VHMLLTDRLTRLSSEQTVLSQYTLFSHFCLKCFCFLMLFSMATIQNSGRCCS
jgi:hypothetical protein